MCAKSHSTNYWEEVIAQDEVNILRIDTGTDHGVGFIIENGVPTPFRLKRVLDYLEGLEGKEA